MSAKKKPNGATPKTDGPPYTLTEHERTDILLRYGFNEGRVDYPFKVLHAGLHDLEYELRALAGQVFNARPESDVWSEDEAREYAVNAAAYARSLCDIANRMMRFAGRAEAYADCLAAAGRAEETVEAFERGELGGRPFIGSERRAEYQASIAAHKAGKDGAS